MANELDFLKELPDETKPKQENISVAPPIVQDEVITQETASLSSDYLDSLPDENSDLNKAFQAIPEADPDKTAKIINVSREIEEPEEFVQENLAEIEQNVQRRTDDEWRAVENESPETSHWLKKDPKNMALAHDDIESLQKNESIFGEMKYATKLMLDPAEKIRLADDLVTGQVTPIKSGFSSGTLQLRMSQIGWNQMAHALVTGKHSGLGDNELNDIEKKLAEYAEKEPGFNPFYFASQQLPNMGLIVAKSMRGAAEGGLVFGLSAAALSMGPQALVAPAAIPGATMLGMQVGGRIRALEAAAIIEGGSAYTKFIKMKDKNGNPVNPRHAAEMALVVGIVNAGLEYASMKALLRTIPGGDKVLKHFVKNKKLLASISPGIAVKNAAKNYLINIGTEVVTEVGQEAVTGIGGEILKKFDKFNIKSFLSNIAQVISPAAQASMLLGSPGTMFSVAKEVNDMSKTDINKQTYDSLGENADQSKLTERSKEVYADQVGSIAESSDAGEAIISVDSFNEKSKELGIDPQELAKELEIEELYQSAINDDSEIAVPTGQWVANTKSLEKKINQPVYSSFSDDVKFKHDEYTKKEQREIGEYYQDQFKKEADVLASKDQEVSAARDQIQEKTYQELVETGTKKEIAKAQATLYADMVVTTTGRVKDATVDEVSDSMVKEIVGVAEIQKPADLLAQFAGLKSMTSDNLKLDAAQARLNVGEDANVIRKETGWFQGKDGKFRYEISDDQASFTFDEKGALPSDIIFKSARGRLKLGDIIKHEQLYKAYPFFENIDVNYNQNLKQFEGITAYYHPGSKSLSLSPDAIKNKEAIMHEIQHAIQDYEGFDGGDNIAALVQTKEDIEQLEQSVLDMEEAFTEMQNYNDPNRNEDISLYQRMGFINKLNRDKAILEQVKGLKPSGEKEAVATGERTGLTVEQRKEQAPAIMMFNGKEIPVKTQELYQDDYAEGFGYIEDETEDQYKIEGNWYNKLIIKPEMIIQGRTPQAEEINQGLIREAVKVFKTTKNFNEAGYLTTDGKLLDFSGKHEVDSGDKRFLNNQRSVDHRQISEIEYQGELTDMYSFMELGNVRLKPESAGFELSKPINDKQKKILSKYINEFDGEILLDLNQPGSFGKTQTFSVEYPKKTSAQRIFSDIEKYYSGQEIQQPSETGKFLYQEQLNDKFYSKLEQTILDKMPEKSNKQQIMGIVKNAGVKQEEIDWIGLPEFLEENPKVTKQEVIDFIQANNPQIEEVVKGKTVFDTKDAREELEERLRDEVNDINYAGGNYWGDTIQDIRSDLIEEIKATEEDAGVINDNYGEEVDAVSFEYEGKTEIVEKDTMEDDDLLDLFGIDENDIFDMIPEGTIELAKDDAVEQGEDFIRDELETLEEEASYGEEEEELTKFSQYQLPGGENYKELLMTLPNQEKEQFKSSHFEEKNILAHVRSNERTDADGNKVLFIEEIQSDWHQKGRKKGYKIDGVPDAPFKKTWHELALKRMVREAAEKGFDKIAWTTDEQQADRYDLSKQVELINAVKGKVGVSLTVADNEGRNVIDSKLYQPEELTDVIGKELADKINAQTEPEHTYSGLDLKVGGEGMKGFYDKIIPSFLNKFGKKFGAKVGKSSIVDVNYKLDDSGSKGIFKYIVLRNKDNVMLGHGKTKKEALEAAKERIKDYSIVVNSMDITPQLKEAALLKGFPLFQEKGKPLGSYNPTTKKVLLAAKAANASTFVHEMSHAWLNYTHDMNKAGRLTEGYKKDWNVLTNWLELTDDQTELTIEQQEQFARGFEAYLQEGKAPTVDLISTFARFKKWMMKIYESITHPSFGLINKNEIAEDIKAVMDRMFATEEEIKASEYYLNYDKELDITGIDQKVKEKLTELKNQAREKAFSTLLSKQMEELSVERKEEIEKSRKIISDGYEQSLRTSALYKAIEAMNTWKKDEITEDGPVQAGKKYRELSSVKKTAGKYLNNDLEETKANMFDIVAESFDFYSGEELATLIVNKKPLKNEVAASVDQEIAEKYPELMGTAEIRDRAIEALHSDKQMEIMAMEREILNSMVADAQSRAEAQRYGQTKAWMETEIAKQKAEAYLSSLEVGKISRISKYITAERINAIKSLKALQKKDYTTAADFKQRQMINHGLALGVVKMQKKKANLDKQINKITRKKKDKFVDQETYDQVHNLLYRFGLAEDNGVKNVEPLSAYLEKLRATYLSTDDESTPLDVVDWILDDSLKKDIDDLNINQYQELLNSIKNIIHVSNSVNKFYRMAKHRSITETIDNLAVVAAKNIKPRKRPRAVKTKFEHVINNVDDYLFSLEQVDTVLGRLDGWKDFGPWQSAISQEVKDAADIESNKRFEAKEKLKKVWSVYTKKEVDDLFKKKLMVPQFGATNDNAITKQQLMAMALNMGNETNLDRLLDTPPVGFYPEFDWSRDNREQTQAIIQSVLEEHLTEKDWDAVQNILDVVNSYWPEIASLHKEITGFEPAKVDALPYEVTLPNGKRKAYKGGYYPLVGDPRYNEQIAIRELTGQPLYEEISPAHKAMTKTGHTKTRTNAKYAISLNLDILNRHLNDIIHDLAFRPLIYDLRRMITNNGFIETVKKHTGDSGYRYIKQWVGAVASGGNTEKFATDQLSLFVREVNNRQTFAIVLMRVSILLQNFANPLLAFGRVKGFNNVDVIKGYFGRGLMNYWPKTVLNWKKAAEMRAFVWVRSTFMRDRSENPEYTLRDFIGVNVTDVATFANFMIGLIGGTDDMTNIPLWIEAYTKKLDETQNEQEAVKFADLLIYRIVGSGRKYDVAKIMRGTDMEKVFSKFYSFWNVEYNNWVRELGKQGKEPIKNTPRFLGFVASKAIFIYYSAWLAHQLPGDDETDERKRAEYLKMFISYPFSMFPFAREIGSLVIDTALGLPTYGYRPSPAASLVGDITRGVGNITKFTKGERQIQDVMESVTKLGSFAFKVPYQLDSWFWNSYDYIVNGMSPTFEDLYKRRPKRKR